MSYYDDNVLPHVINCVCSTPPILGLRKEVVPKCTGRVLEVGMGSAINLQYYTPENVEFIWGLEPSEGMRKKAQKNLVKSKIPVKWLGLRGEEIPLKDDSVDTILLTYTLCTIPDAAKALEQMRRVLKPDGKLLFCEHGESDSSLVSTFQNSINPLWGKIAGGCNLNRKIDFLIRSAGFNIDKIKRFHLHKTPKFAGYTYLGEATLC